MPNLYPEVSHFLICPFGAKAGHRNKFLPCLECARVRSRVDIFLPQLPLSGFGVNCSQSPCNHPRPLCYGALGYSVPEAGAQADTFPLAGLSLQEQLPTMVGLTPWWALHLLVQRVCLSMWRAKARTQSIRVPKQENQEPSAPRAESEIFFLPPLLEVLSPKSNALQKPVGVSTFPTNEANVCHIFFCPSSSSK